MSTIRETLEPAVVRSVITAMAGLAVAYDGMGLLAAWQGGGLVDVGRAISAVALGWMCGWYLTVKFQPTHRWLLNTFLSWAGHAVALCAAAMAMALMGLVDLLGADAQRATFLGITSVTFAPVAAHFATQLTEDRSVHLVSGVGIGALAYVVLLGIPD